MDAHEVIELAEVVAVDGPEEHEDALTALVEDARHRGCASDVVVDVVGDRTAPPVVRQRALGRLVAAMVPVGSTSTPPAPRPAPAPVAARSAVQEARWSMRWLWQL